MSLLTPSEIDQCHQTFAQFDSDNSGSIDLWELKSILQAMGQAPSEEELFKMISEVDAFVALGGNADKTGEVATEKLQEVIKLFSLEVDVAQLVREADTDSTVGGYR